MTTESQPVVVVLPVGKALFEILALDDEQLTKSWAEQGVVIMGDYGAKCEAHCHSLTAARSFLEQAYNLTNFGDWPFGKRGPANRQLHRWRNICEITKVDVPTEWPTKKDPCFDCGSTIPGHHTPLCEMGEGREVVRDLPAEPGTQYWTGEPPVK